MVLKIYALVWSLVAALAGLSYVTGNLNEMTVTVFALVISTLAAVGVVTVLPWWVDRKYTWRYQEQ
jgi:putative flippase GtrA